MASSFLDDSAGKQKGDTKSKCSLFVRGIPANSSNDELVDFFSNVGPLRSCFIANSVKGESEALSKFCYGFVRFVTEEDAQRAIEQLRAIKFKGSKLKLEIALKKQHGNDEKRPPKKTPVSKVKKDPLPGKNANLKKNMKRKLEDIYVSSLPDGVEKKQLFKKFKKFGTVVSLEFPYNEDKTKCNFRAFY